MRTNDLSSQSFSNEVEGTDGVITTPILSLVALTQWPLCVIRHPPLRACSRLLRNSLVDHLALLFCDG
jgi:hypothetical protein